jgi:hypothetical protein
MRKQVRKVVVWIILSTILFAIAVVLTVFIRMGLSAGSDFLAQGIPFAFLAVCRDPILLVAFVIAAILLWIAPWEGARSLGDDDDESDVIRGREVTSLRDARRRAEAKLRAQRAGLRAGRQGPRGRSDL